VEGNGGGHGDALNPESWRLQQHTLYLIGRSDEGEQEGAHRSRRGVTKPKSKRGCCSGLNRRGQKRTKSKKNPLRESKKIARLERRRPGEEGTLREKWGGAGGLQGGGGHLIVRKRRMGLNET